MDREESYRAVVKLAAQMLIHAGLHDPNKRGGSYSGSFAQAQASGMAADWVAKHYGHHVINFIDEGITSMKVSYKWATGNTRGGDQDYVDFQQRKARRIAQKVLQDHN